MASAPTHRRRLTHRHRLTRRLARRQRLTRRRARRRRLTHRRPRRRLTHRRRLAHHAANAVMAAAQSVVATTVTAGSAAKSAGMVTGMRETHTVTNASSLGTAMGTEVTALAQRAKMAQVHRSMAKTGGQMTFRTSAETDLRAMVMS